MEYPKMTTATLQLAQDRAMGQTFGSLNVVFIPFWQSLLHWFFKIKFESSSGHSSYHIGAQQNIDLLGVKWRVLCKIFKGEIYFLKSQKSEIVFLCIIGRVLLGRAFVFQIKRSQVRAFLSIIFNFINKQAYINFKYKYNGNLLIGAIMPVDIGLCSRVVELLTRVTGVWILGNSSSLLSYYNTFMQFRGRKFGNQHEIQQWT